LTRVYENGRLMGNGHPMISRAFKNMNEGWYNASPSFLPIQSGSSCAKSDTSPDFKAIGKDSKITLQIPKGNPNPARLIRQATVSNHIDEMPADGGRRNPWSA